MIRGPPYLPLWHAYLPNNERGTVVAILRIMTAREGDQLLICAPSRTDDDDAVEMSQDEVNQKFAELTEKGFSMLRVDPDTKEASRIGAGDFDASTDIEVIGVPQIKGG